MAPKTTTGINLLPGQAGLFRIEKARVRLACNRVGEAVVGAVTSLGVLRTSAAWFAAPDGTFGQRAAAHGLGIG